MNLGNELRIGLNATCINDRPSGAKQRFVGIYRELVRKLPEVEFVVFEPIDCRVGLWFDGLPNISVRQTPLHSEGRIRKFLTGLNYWPTTLPTAKLDSFECFNQPLVKALGAKTILTIHDARRIHPDWSGWERFVYKLALARDLRAADHVITVSHTMKDEILGFWPNSSISVIYNGIDVSGFEAVTEVEMQAFRQKFDLPPSFVLAVGHFERRKNYLRLIESMAKVHERGISCQLIIVGNDSGDGKVMAERIQQLNMAGIVRILSGLSDLEVRCAYRLCSLFAFPSSYEGFGIPILEAMAAGCPMVLSDIPVFREITENCSVYFPHDDSVAIADAIEMVLSSSSERERQINYGKLRVKDFSFNNLADQLAGLYRGQWNS